MIIVLKELNAQHYILMGVAHHKMYLLIAMTTFAATLKEKYIIKQMQRLVILLVIPIKIVESMAI